MLLEAQRGHNDSPAIRAMAEPLPSRPHRQDVSSTSSTASQSRTDQFPEPIIAIFSFLLTPFARDAVESDVGTGAMKLLEELKQRREVELDDKLILIPARRLEVVVEGRRRANDPRTMEEEETKATRM